MGLPEKHVTTQRTESWTMFVYYISWPLRSAAQEGRRRYIGDDRGCSAELNNAVQNEHPS